MAYRLIAYGVFPEIMRIKADVEMNNAEFAAREHEMAPIKQELMRLFPAIQSRQIPFTWLTAADYFVCRRAHQAPFIVGTEAHGDAAEKHLAFRFHKVGDNLEVRWRGMFSNSRFPV